MQLGRCSYLAIANAFDILLTPESIRVNGKRQLSQVHPTTCTAESGCRVRHAATAGSIMHTPLHKTT